MNKAKLFIKSFVSNTEVLKASEFHFLVIMLIFVINVSLISVPNFVGKMNSVDYIDNMVGIEEAFSEMYDDQLDCQVVDAMMSCDITNGTEYEGYEVSFVDEIDVENIESSEIQFSESLVVIVYVDEDDMSYAITGTYTLITDFDFSSISTSDFGNRTKEEYYFDVNDNLLTGIYFSTLDQELSYIYMAQFMQVLIYLMVITVVFMLANFKSDVKRVTFQNANKIIIVAMTGPALLVAILGIFLPTWASILFFIIFAIRAMFIYYRIAFHKESANDETEEMENE